MHSLLPLYIFCCCHSYVFGETRLRTAWNEAFQAAIENSGTRRLFRCRPLMKHIDRVTTLIYIHLCQWGNNPWHTDRLLILVTCTIRCFRYQIKETCWRRRTSRRDMSCHAVLASSADFPLHRIIPKITVIRLLTVCLEVYNLMQIFCCRFIATVDDCCDCWPPHSTASPKHIHTQQEANSAPRKPDESLCARYSGFDSCSRHAVARMMTSLNAIQHVGFQFSGMYSTRVCDRDEKVVQRNA